MLMVHSVLRSLLSAVCRGNRGLHSPPPKPQPQESQEYRIATASVGPVSEQGRTNFEKFFAEALEGGAMEVGVVVWTQYIIYIYIIVYLLDGT